MKCSRCRQENPPQAKFSLFEDDEAALVLVRERALRRGVTLEQSIDPRLDEIQGDERKIKHLNLPKLLEHRLMIRRRDADSSVAHRNLHVLAYGLRANPDSPTLQRELDRVGQQVQEHLRRSGPRGQGSESARHALVWVPM